MASRRLQLVLNLDTGGYSGKISRAGSQMKSFSGNVDRGSRSLRQMDRSFDGLNRAMRTPLDKLRDYVLILSNIRLAIMNVRDITVGWVGAMVKQSAEVERLTILMKGLSEETGEFAKSVDAAQNLSALMSMARQNGFALREMTDAFVKLRAGGIDPMNGSLSSLTDAVAKFGGTSETMHRASIAIQQMAGKGVISMEELRQQLGEAVPTAMKDMARAAGMELKKFTDLVSKGKVQAAPALELMFREFQMRYAGAGERIAQTLNGQMAAMKTNVMELSTFFTGQAQQNNLAWMAYVEAQKKLLKENKITEAQFEANTSRGDDSLYSSLADGLKEFNQALQSSEAKAFMFELGQAIGDIARSLMNVVKWVVEWRDEIWVIAKTIGMTFAMWKAYQIGKWVLSLRTAFVDAFTRASLAVDKNNTVLGKWQNQMSRSATYYDRLQQRQKKSAELADKAVFTGSKRIRSLREEANGLRLLSDDYAKNARIIDTQRRASEAALRQGRATGKYRDYATGTFISQNKAIENNSKLIAAGTRNRAAAAKNSKALAATEAKLAAAVNNQSAAVAKATAATTGLTKAQQRYNMMARAGAKAARGLGMAMNVALGPIGLVAFALYQAADAAGVFENKADKATAAAARLMQGIASLEDMQSVRDSLDGLHQKQKQDRELLENGGRWTTYKGAGGEIKQRFVELSDEEKAAVQSRIDNRSVDIKDKAQSLDVGGYAYRLSRADQFSQGYSFRRDRRNQEGQREYERYLRDNPDDIAGANALRSRLQEENAKKDQQFIDSLTARADAAEEAGNTGLSETLLMYVDSTKQAIGATGELRKSDDELRDSLLGAGKATGGLTSEQKKQASAFDKYQDMIARNAGDIAELSVQLEGGEGKLAEFQARMKHGLFDDATPEQLAEMATQFARIDQLNDELDFKQSFGQLKKDLAEANTEATELWRSLQAGTWDEDLRESEVRSRYTEQVSAAEATGDPNKIAEVEAAIQKMIATLNKIDAADIAREWELATEDIRISLMTEDEARQANFDREVERQRKMIELAGQDVQLRRQMEERYYAWLEQRKRQLVRENESGVITMARDWAQLGQAMDKVATDSVSSIVDGLAEGKFAFDDFVKDILKQILKVILQAMIAYAILSAVGATKGMSFGTFMKGQMTGFQDGFANQGGKGGDMSNVESWDASSFGAQGFDPDRHHTGGWFGSGALKAGEVPIIGKEGEVALTEGQQRFYGKAFDAALAGNGAPNIEINMINNSGTAVQAEQGGSRFEGKKMIVDVVVDALSKEGPLRNSVEQITSKR